VLLEFFASKWRILDKAIETKVDTGVEIVKCIALLHNIVIDVEGLHESSSNDNGSLNANDGTQLKKTRTHNSVTATAKQMRDLFCNYFNSPAGSVPWQEEAIRGAKYFKAIITQYNHLKSVLHICT
jgi:hypothetical protein